MFLVKILVHLYLIIYYIVEENTFAFSVYKRLEQQKV